MHVMWRPTSEGIKCECFVRSKMISGSIATCESVERSRVSKRVEYWVGNFDKQLRRGRFFE
jgi:hypothetical protein